MNTHVNIKAVVPKVIAKVKVLGGTEGQKQYAPIFDLGGHKNFNLGCIL
jgi:hypothetical protein